jgi:hypothetical protein
MIAQIKDPTNKTEYFEFTDNGKRIISAPYYIKERDWVFVELTDRDIAFASHDAITSTIGVMPCCPYCRFTGCLVLYFCTGAFDKQRSWYYPRPRYPEFRGS